MHMLLAGERHRQLALDDEQHALGAGVGFRPVAAAAGRDLHDVLRERLGKARQRPRSTQSAGLVPERQGAGDDVAHHALGNDRIGLGEHGAAGQQLGLRRDGRRAAHSRLRLGHFLIMSMCSSLLRKHVFEPEQRDALDLVAGGVEFGRAAVADARFEAARISSLVLPFTAMMNGKAEGGDIGGVELGEQLALLVGQRVEAGGGLFLGRLRPSAAWPAPACRQGRDGR